MNYKRFISSREVRHKILNCLRWIPDSVMLRLQYKIHTGRILHLKKPIRYTEKIQHYKAFYRNPDLCRCVDKFEVRNYLTERGFGQYLNRMIGVYDNVAQIDFSKLPDKYVVKTTSGGGNLEVFICRENSVENQKLICRLFNNVESKIKGASLGREWAYDGIKRTRIIIEEYLENPDNPVGGIDDYKLICTNGRVRCIVLDTNRNIDHKRNIYDREWNDLRVSTDHPCTDCPVPKPDNLEKLIELAESISAPFPHVRVDLYNIKGKIYFGELTFYPWSGYVSFYPDDFDIKLGKEFDISYL